MKRFNSSKNRIYLAGYIVAITLFIYLLLVLFNMYLSLGIKEIILLFGVVIALSFLIFIATVLSHFDILIDEESLYLKPLFFKAKKLKFDDIDGWLVAKHGYVFYYGHALCFHVPKDFLCDEFKLLLDNLINKIKDQVVARKLQKINGEGLKVKLSRIASNREPKRCLTVTADGIRITRFRKRFYTWSEIKSFDTKKTLDGSSYYHFTTNDKKINIYLSDFQLKGGIAVIDFIKQKLEK